MTNARIVYQNQQQYVKDNIKYMKYHLHVLHDCSLSIIKFVTSGLIVILTVDNVIWIVPFPTGPSYPELPRGLQPAIRRWKCSPETYGNVRASCQC